MTSKYQRRMEGVAAKHGERFALERTVLDAARALRGSVKKYGTEMVPSETWQRFLNAEDALHAFHAERQRRKNGARQ